MGNSCKKENEHGNYNALNNGPNIVNNPPQNVINFIKPANYDKNYHSVGNIQKIVNFVNPPKNLQLTNINVIPEYVYTYTQLEILSLSYGKISIIRDNIGNLINLRELNLSSNNLLSLPSSICNLQKLTTLTLSKNKLTTLPENFGNLINLTKLIITNNNITSLPETFGNLVNLKTLSLNSNKLINLPDSFGNLISLTTLHLEHNNLINLPNNFHHLIDLSTLFLKFNKLEFMNENIKIMKHNKKFHIPVSSYNINNLSIDSEFIFITDLSKNLTNLPMNMKEIRLHRPKVKKVKVPFDCLLYINDILITDKN